MSRKHISEDGQVRNCTAKTPEACTAIGPDGKKAEHFPEYYAAKRRSEELLANQYGETSTIVSRSQEVNNNIKMEELEIKIDANKRRLYELRARKNDAPRSKIVDLNKELSRVNAELESNRKALGELKSNRKISQIDNIKNRLKLPDWQNFTPEELSQLSGSEWQFEQTKSISKMAVILQQNKKLAALQKAHRINPESKEIQQKYLEEAERTGYTNEDRLRQVSNLALKQESALSELENINNVLGSYKEPFLSDNISSFMYNNYNNPSYEAYHSIPEKEWKEDRLRSLHAKDLLEKNKQSLKKYRSIENKYRNSLRVAPSALAYNAKKIRETINYLNNNSMDAKARDRLKYLKREKQDIEDAIAQTGKTNEMLELEYVNAREIFANVDAYLGINALKKRINTAEKALESYGHDSQEWDYSFDEFDY